MDATQTTPEDAVRAATPDIDPRFIQELLDNKEAAQNWFRVNAVLQYRELVIKSRDPDFPVGLQIKLAESMAKNGDALPRRADDERYGFDSKPTIQIVFEGDEPRSISARPVPALIEAEQG